MAFTLEHVQQVRNGQPRQVGVLPDSVWRKLEWPCPWVYLGRTGLAHIEEQHPDITDIDLLNLPFAVASGMIVQVKRDPRQVLVAYRSHDNRIYQCALKSAQSGTEVWVSSFYRIKSKGIRRILRQGDLLRGHQ